MDLHQQSSADGADDIVVGEGYGEALKGGNR
jgi:hypothetical protein